MCLGIPMKLVEIRKDFLALAEVKGIRREISIFLLQDEKLRVGDWVMVHTGSAIGKLDEGEALESLRFLEEILSYEGEE